MKYFLLLLLCISLQASPAKAADQFGVVTQSDVSVTVTSTKFLDANSLRRYLMIVNKGSASMLVKIGAAHSASEGVLIPAGGNWEPMSVPVGSVYMESVTGTQTAAVLEGN